MKGILGTGIKLDRYNRSVELDAAELKFVSYELVHRVKFSRTRQPDLSIVHRLVKPLDDVFDYIDFHGPKRQCLLFFLLEEMGRRRKSFWGWADGDWIEVVDSQRYYGNRLVAVAYLLCGFRSLDAFEARRQVFFRLAQRVLGPQRFADIIADVENGLASLGYKPRTQRMAATTVAQLLMTSRSPGLECLSREFLGEAQQKTFSAASEKCLIALSRLLASKGVIDAPLTRLGKPRYLDDPEAFLAGVPDEWARMARYWFDNSSLSFNVRLRHYYRVLCVGRWLQATHPEISGPAEWTRSTAAEAVAMLATQTSGEWSHLPSDRIRNFGKPYAAPTRMLGMTALRTFFQDLQEWDLIRPRFEPYRAFRAPRSITCLIERNPRVIADDVWAKLVWAGMNLTGDDISGHGRGPHKYVHYYPPAMVRAVTLVWLFAGLRWHEIRRLRLGCVRWQEDAQRGQVCLLSVPVNKTGTAHSKPVDKLVGEAIEAWEKERPAQAKLVDTKTGEQVDFLFLYRFRQLGYNYLNYVLIRDLCEKAGIPREDVRGKITGHRARATIATQLFNARDPMSLFELQEWLGHKHASSTQSYTKITPTKLMKAYAKAGYFERNLRAIEVLIDQDTVRRGLGDKEPWKFFDLGHGFCTYDFFDQCPHRMACAKCSFYLPKESARAQMLEAKSNLLRLQQAIPLTEPEIAAIDEGVAAYDKLVESLHEVPTPSGQTPRELTVIGSEMNMQTRKRK
jgi:integrase